ncbi:DoxX family protein [Edaphobacter albus]|uniref:DoxX family protein n=1 Tax=Edaphobacter sp. 4G125 TaxID=2763071 RepID=UPI0016458EEF|nr:DoxX family protein [Edaphobacter sp. 4G125]QNI35952.1 DoxX family protein [Edaphobacter sp. 4G125]
MTVALQTAPSKTRLYTGYVLSTLAIFFLVMDACMKFTTNPQVIAAQTQLGWPMQLSPAIAILALICTALYALPATSVLGALLLTGYLGGAIALHLRVDNPLFSHTLFPVYVALFIWGGLWLRNATLREVLPLASHPIANTTSQKQLWTGYIVTAISALLILFTAVMKFVYVPKPGEPILFPQHHIHHLAYIEILCTILYLLPSTSFLGATLLVSYLGGATCINLREGQPLGTSLITVVIGIVVMAGPWLLDSRLRRLFPIRSTSR